MESSVKWMRHISRASQSVRFFACPVSESSATARNFFFAHYNHVKTLAPNFAFQIRHTGEEPYMMVEYDFGETAKIGLSGLKEADIVAKLEQAVSIGAAMPRSDNQSGAPRLEANILPSVVE